MNFIFVKGDRDLASFSTKSSQLSNSIIPDLKSHLCQNLHLSLFSNVSLFFVPFLFSVQNFYIVIIINFKTHFNVWRGFPYPPPPYFLF